MGAARRVHGCPVIAMTTRFTCLQCKAPLAARNRRCRNCGWASDYNPALTQRHRELATGVTLILLGLLIAIGVALGLTLAN